MTAPRISVGMATHTDYYGCVDTIQHIRMTNRRIAEVEFVVVDSSIGSPLALSQSHSRDLKNFLASCNRGCAGVKLIEMPEADGFGTTQPRNLVFKEATGDIVLCVDSHIMPEPYAIDRLIEYFERNPNSNDLIQGPILHDNLTVMASGFADEWRDEMWGIWDLDTKCLSDGFTEDLPVIDRQEQTANIAPFEIQSMGLGLFGCRREAWLGFNPHFRGFGGEEWYIHRKYRKAGYKCLCLPFLRWWHRFGRPGGISYTISTEHKVRNYILGHRELDDSLAGIHQQFVASGKLAQARWDWLKADPENNVPERHIPQQIRSQGQAARPNNAVAGDVVDHSLSGFTVDNIFDAVKATPRDLNEHMDTLRLWASKVEHVTEFSERKESTIGFLSGRPVGDDKRSKFIFRSFNTDQDPLILRGGPLHTALAQEVNDNATTSFTQTVGDSMNVPSIDETDVLFIDTKHNGNRLSAELLKHGSKVRRAIIVHDTAGWLPMVKSQGWGETGDDGGPGLNEALRNWVSEHPEWFVAVFDPNQYGLTILSKHPDDRPKEVVNAWLPGYGPGTEFQKILKSVDINPSAGCDCNAKAAQMDIWGVVGCEEHLAEIIQWLKDGEGRWGWKDKWSGAAKMLVKDPLLAISLDPTDPFPGLIKASIKRARKHELKLLKDKQKAARR